MFPRRYCLDFSQSQYTIKSLPPKANLTVAMTSHLMIFIWCAYLFTNICLRVFSLFWSKYCDKYTTLACISSCYIEIRRIWPARARKCPEKMKEKPRRQILMSLRHWSQIQKVKHVSVQLIPDLNASDTKAAFLQ